MRLVELRDLDGPNIFLLQPAIKVEFAAGNGDDPDPAELARRFELPDTEPAAQQDAAETLPFAKVIERAIGHFHRRSGLAVPPTVAQTLETPGHVAVAFGWDHRRFAMQLARDVAETVEGHFPDWPMVVARLHHALSDVSSDDRPAMVRDGDRRLRTIAVTGTNGKTTTTRLIAHTLRTAGLRVGWCSSSGVYVEGTEIVQGDYSGPSGARRVLLEPGLDAGVLETARGGILLRGLAYESNDVSVFTNVSADHLDLQGVRTVEGLARVKSVVVRVTKADGFAVLNADDPLVIGATADVRASRLLFSQQPANPLITAHRASGGIALIGDEARVVVCQGEAERSLTDLAEMPIAYGGAARHMVENALAAAGACLAFGLTDEQIRAGLSSFDNSPELNAGRLNIFSVRNVTVIVDYAHNEAGLKYLLGFARRFCGTTSRLISIIGTAGDRTDHSLREIGRIAATESDAVIVKGTERYLRGRSLPELIDLYCAGIKLGGMEPLAIEPLELPALESAMAVAKDGDVIAMMAQEQIPEILQRLRERGGAYAGHAPFHR
jgi:cyanophycin synthetase